jgi:hypothetical protein
MALLDYHVPSASKRSPVGLALSLIAAFLPLLWIPARYSFEVWAPPANSGSFGFIFLCCLIPTLAWCGWIVALGCWAHQRLIRWRFYMGIVWALANVALVGNVFVSACHGPGAIRILPF